MTTERERFEAWAKTTHPRWRFDKSRSDDGYMYAPTATAWRAWQAALSAPPGTENRRAQPAAPAACSSCDGTGKISGLPCAWCMQSAAPSVAPEPVAWMWQHDETGRTGFVGSGFDRAHWEEHNPRLKIIAPCFVHPPRAPLSDEHVYAVVRSVQPHLATTSKAWRELAEDCRYWLKAERAVTEAAHGIRGQG